MIFLLASILAFSIPGYYILSFYKEASSFWEKFFIGTAVGFTLFTLISYCSIIIKVPFLPLVLTIATDVLALRVFLKELKKIKLPGKAQLLVIISVFVIGIAGQLAVISPSGRVVNGDLLFWSSHGHDGSWHIALVEEMQKGWPFQNPVFSGEKLVNYHYFSDITLAIFNKYLGISNLDLYFRYFPFLYSLLLGTSVYFLTKKMTGSFWAPIWATVFTYFAGSFGYLIGKGESVFWATQIQSASGNPPQIVSDFLVLTFLYFILIYLQKRQKMPALMSILILGSLAEFKVYAAVVLLIATFISGVWLVAIPAGILAAILYLPNSVGGTSFLIFQPWWYIRTMIVEPSRLNLVDWELRRQTYIYEHNWKRVIFLEGVGFLIFFFGNLGMRFVGLWDFVKSGRSILKDRFNRIFILTIPISIALPLLFLQKGVASNTGQFLQYFILLFGILAGISTVRVIKLIKYPALQILTSAAIIFLMIPTQVGLLKDFYGTPQNGRAAFAKVSKQELVALEFLNKNTKSDAVILSSPKNNDIKDTSPTPNIWAWADTGYVAALSERREFFSDRERVDIMGYNFAERGQIKKDIFQNTDPVKVKNLIKSSRVNYLYFPISLAPKADLAKAGLSKVFNNPEVEIWQAK